MVACHKIPIQKQVVSQYIRNKQTMVKAEGERKEGEQETIYNNGNKVCRNMSIENVNLIERY